MALAGVTTSVRRHLRSKELIVKVTPTGNYVVGGDTLNLAAITAPVGMENATVGYPGKVTSAFIMDAPAGYTGKLIPGTALTNWKLLVSSGAAVELLAAAYPAPALASSFTISLTGPKMQF